jgi:hypothetical protein
LNDTKFIEISPGQNFL